MNTKNHIHWFFTQAVCSTVIGALIVPSTVYAAERNAKMEVRPFCTSEQNDDNEIFGPIPDVEGYVTLGDDKCPLFNVEDPETLATVPMRKGEVLDFDIVIRNPSKQPIHNVRSWIAYDPNVLEGKSIDIYSNFPEVTPGESDFDPDNGYIMIEASNNKNSPNKKKNVLVARVRMKVLNTPESGTAISFYDEQPGGHTAVHTTENGADEYVLDEVSGSLHVIFTQEPAETPNNESGNGSENENANNGGDTTENDNNNGNNQGNSEDSGSSGNDLLDDLGDIFKNMDNDSNDGSDDSSDSDANENSGETNTGAGEGSDNEPSNDSILEGNDSAESTTDNDAVSGGSNGENDNSQQQRSPGQRTAFSLLQTRNVRVATEGTSLYVGWDALNHPDLKAYNIYYGTTSGRYIQRKTVDKGMKSLIIRSLPYGSTYYVAVRAVNLRDEESAFSKEASVEIGNPLTSSNPLVAGTIDNGPNGVNPVEGSLTEEEEVPGEVGIPSGMTLLVILSAITGTAIALRRQIVVTSAHHIQ